MDYKDSMEYIESVFKVNKSLVHASNVIRKCKSYKGTKAQAMQNLAVKYADYLQRQLALKGYSVPVIKKRVALLNDYYSYYDNNSAYNYNSLFSSQGKLRPTILEEFVYFLFKDCLDDMKKRPGVVADAYSMGATKAYTNLYFSPLDFVRFSQDPSIKINVKDQDFAIYRKIGFNVGDNLGNSKSYEAKVPVVAVEVKTYLDKTMLESAVATAEKLKMGNPYSRFVVVAEAYQVSTDVDPSYSQIDQIYVLRKCRDHNDLAQTIDADVVKRLFNEAKQHLDGIWSDVKTKLEKQGVVI